MSEFGSSKTSSSINETCDCSNIPNEIIVEQRVPVLPYGEIILGTGKITRVGTTNIWTGTLSNGLSIVAECLSTFECPDNFFIITADGVEQSSVKECTYNGVCSFGGGQYYSAYGDWTGGGYIGFFGT